MSQAPEPDKDGGASPAVEESDHTLFVEKHVGYIKSLDTVCVDIPRYYLPVASLSCFMRTANW